MRLWSVHPRYLDPQGLVALWREGLLAQKVLQGATRGYRHHPQLRRFRSRSNPAGLVAWYLHRVCDEAGRRGYRFDRSKLCERPGLRRQPLPLTEGQLAHEWRHLLSKLEKRAPQRLEELKPVTVVEPHPLFRLVPGEVEDWEVVAPAPAPARRRPARSTRRRSGAGGKPGAS